MSWKLSDTALDRAIGWTLFVIAFAALWATAGAVGYTRDESFYFLAGGNHGNWFELLFTNPRAALQDANITRWFQYNNEHPGLAKNLFGISNLIFFEKLGWLGSAEAYRLPAFLLGALFAPLAYWMGTGLYGRTAGLFAALSWFVIPRQFFNSQLSCFDVPVAAFWVLTVYAFWRAQERPRWWIGCGVAFGLALATKHNAFFLPLVLAPFVLYLAFKRSAGNAEAKSWASRFVGLFVAVAVLYALLVVVLGPKGFQQRFFLLSPHTLLYLAMLAGGAYILRRLYLVDRDTFRPLASAWAMAALGPLVLYLAWPYLWHHPVDRVAFWLNFHATHNHYAWFYLGTLLREPPFPLAYVIVKTALTVPTSIFVPMVIGFFAVVARLVGVHVAAVRRYVGKADWRDALVVANAVASIAVISHPNVPHFGGVKHWFPSMPFLGILGGMAVTCAAAFVAGRVAVAMRRKVTVTAVALPMIALLGVPAAIATARVHPYGTSYYSELAGGLPGAATLGMQRQFWSNNVTGVLPWINENAMPNARVFLHEVTQLAFVDYQRNGQLRSDLRFAGGPHDADLAAYQYHQEFREHEFNIWESFGTTRPVTGLYVDETPQVVVYQR